MESAEIIQRGNLKFTGYPVLVLGEDGADNEVGIVLCGGYRFTDRLDGELAVDFYDAATLFGGNVEVALMRAGPVVRGVDLSVPGGVHRVLRDVADATGLDLAALLSTHLTPNLELVEALDFDRSFFDGPLEDVGTLTWCRDWNTAWGGRWTSWRSWAWGWTRTPRTTFRWGSPCIFGSRRWAAKRELTPS